MNLGAKLAGDVDTQLSVLNSLGMPYVRTSEALTGYDGRIGYMDKADTKGINTMLNIVWENARNGVIRKFPRDLNLFEEKLRRLLTKYKPEVAFIENEPTTDLFWGEDPIDFYIEEAQVAVKVCHELGVKVADGGTHINNWLILKNGHGHSKNSADVNTLLSAEIDFDYINFHHRVRSDSDVSNLEGAIKWAQDFTGLPVLTNEFHINGANERWLRDSVNICGNLGVGYFIKWGAGGEDTPLNKGRELTGYGKIYKTLGVSTGR